MKTVKRANQRHRLKAAEGSVKLIGQLHGSGIQEAVVSSSQNCATVLDAAKLDTSSTLKSTGNLRHSEMIHHERFKPPSRDYPADEWNVIAPNSWPDGNDHGTWPPLSRDGQVLQGRGTERGKRYPDQQVL